MQEHRQYVNEVEKEEVPVWIRYMPRRSSRGMSLIVSLESGNAQTSTISDSRDSEIVKHACKGVATTRSCNKFGPTSTHAVTKERRKRKRSEEDNGNNNREEEEVSVDTTQISLFGGADVDESDSNYSNVGKMHYSEQFSKSQNARRNVRLRTTSALEAAELFSIVKL